MGECDNNPGYMLPTCPNECPGSICGYWANTGECEKNPGYMLPNCPNECDKNFTPLPPISTIPIVINTPMGQSNNSIIKFKGLFDI